MLSIEREVGQVCACVRVYVCTFGTFVCYTYLNKNFADSNQLIIILLGGESIHGDVYCLCLKVVEDAEFIQQTQLVP